MGMTGICKRHHNPCLMECSTSLGSPYLHMWPNLIMMQSRPGAARLSLAKPIQLILMYACLSLSHSLFLGPNRRSAIQHINCYYHSDLKNLEIVMTHTQVLYGAFTLLILTLFEILSVDFLN